MSPYLALGIRWWFTPSALSQLHIKRENRIQKTYLRTVLTFSDLSNHVDPIGCKFYIPLMRLFHLNSQLFAQKNSQFTLFFIALGCVCLIFSVSQKWSLQYFGRIQFESWPAFLSAQETQRLAQSSTLCWHATGTRKPKAKLKFILVETLL